MKFALTKRQVARGARPDAETYNKIYLIKNVSHLNATYQIRLLLYRASETKKKLVLDVPRACKLGESLKTMIKEHSRHLEVQRS